MRSERVKKPDTDLVAIDPGDRWTGVAFFALDEDGHWYCQDAVEMGREEFEDGFTELVLSEDNPSIVVYERFRLYNDKAKLQTGSEFITAQIIGVIKFVTRTRNAHFQKHQEAEAEGKMVSCELAGGGCEDPAKVVRGIQVVGQMADIKKPIRGILKAKGIRSVAKPIAKELYGGRDHVVDAELHGWYFILKVLEGVPATD